jgi:hypothetical protein
MFGFWGLIDDLLLIGNIARTSKISYSGCNGWSRGCLDGIPFFLIFSPGLTVNVFDVGNPIERCVASYIDSLESKGSPDRVAWLIDKDYTWNSPSGSITALL